MRELEGGMPEAAADPRFANITERTTNIDALSVFYTVIAVSLFVPK